MQTLPGDDTHAAVAVGAWNGAALACSAAMTIHHLTIAVRGRLALARDEAEHRALVRTMARVAADRLVVFNAVDDHVHAGIRDAHPRRLADGIHRAISAGRRDLELKSPHLEPVTTRSYLRWLVDYVLDQSSRHGLPGTTTALWTGSCFQDLVGARLLPGFNTAPLRQELPRLRLRELFLTVGLDPTPLEPADDEALLRAGPAKLADLAAGVHAVGPLLLDRTAATVRARALASQVAVMVGIKAAAVARFLGITPRAVRLHAATAPGDRELLAIRRRLALEDRVASRGARPRSA